MDLKINELKESYMPYFEKAVDAELLSTMAEVFYKCKELIDTVEYTKLEEHHYPVYGLLKTFVEPDCSPSAFVEHIQKQAFSATITEMYSDLNEDSIYEHQLIARIYDVVEDAYGILYSPPTVENQKSIKENMKMFLELFSDTVEPESTTAPTDNGEVK